MHYHLIGAIAEEEPCLGTHPNGNLNTFVREVICGSGHIFVRKGYDGESCRVLKAIWSRGKDTWLLVVSKFLRCPSENGFVQWIAVDDLLLQSFKCFVSLPIPQI